jgi:RNA polymerase sigma-70 factor (ECF subfamily)
MMKAMPEKEADWLTGARQLDQEALASIYNAFSSALFRYAYRLLGDPEAAEDIVSETFYRFLRSIGAGGGPQNHLKAYLYRVVHNLIMDRYRRNPITEVDFHSEIQNLADGLEDPAYQAELSIEKQAVRRNLWKLTDDQRQVIVLKYLEGLSNQEVSEIMGKPIGAIKSLQHRGLNSLRRIFAKDERKRSSKDVNP